MLCRPLVELVRFVKLVEFVGLVGFVPLVSGEGACGGDSKAI